MADKKERKNKNPSKKWSKYASKDGKLDRKRSCPKCGPGVFLGDYKDRVYCGSCHYVEYNKKEE